MVFTGKSGAVRIRSDQVAFCMNSGSGRIGYKDTVFEGHGPFERVVKLSDLKPGVHVVSDTYEKKWVAADIGGRIVVEGEAPFEASMEGETIRVRTRGRARLLYVTRPPFLLMPEYFVDGQQWMACWTDYPGSDWGRYADKTALIGLSVPEGAHELLVRNMIFPQGWTRPFTPTIAGALVEK